MFFTQSSVTIRIIHCEFFCSFMLLLLTCFPLLHLFQLVHTLMKVSFMRSLVGRARARFRKIMTLKWSVREWAICFVDRLENEYWGWMGGWCCKQQKQMWENLSRKAIKGLHIFLLMFIQGWSFRLLYFSSSPRKKQTS